MYLCQSGNEDAILCEKELDLCRDDGQNAQISRAPKICENHLLIFVFVDPFSKSLVDFLFLLIFQQISTNQQIQQK